MAARKQPSRQPRRRSNDGQRDDERDEARRGLAGVTRRIDDIAAFGKNILWLALLVGGMLTFTWNFIGKPQAEQFIDSTVQDTVNVLEGRIADLQVALEEGKGDVAATKAQMEALKAQLEAITAQISILNRSAEVNQERQQKALEILELLQKQIAATQPGN